MPTTVYSLSWSLVFFTLAGITNLVRLLYALYESFCPKVTSLLAYFVIQSFPIIVYRGEIIIA